MDALVQPLVLAADWIFGVGDLVGDAEVLEVNDQLQTVRLKARTGIIEITLGQAKRVSISERKKTIQLTYIGGNRAFAQIYE